MKKEEPSINSVRGNPNSLEETKGSLSRPGRTALARIEKPALSLNREFPTEPVADAPSIEPDLLMLLRTRTEVLRRTAVCRAACTVVWGPGGETRSATGFERWR
jgi:hypothetical protein